MSSFGGDHQARTVSRLAPGVEHAIFKQNSQNMIAESSQQPLSNNSSVKQFYVQSMSTSSTGSNSLESYPWVSFVNEGGLQGQDISEEQVVTDVAFS